MKRAADVLSDRDSEIEALRYRIACCRNSAQSFREQARECDERAGEMDDRQADFEEQLRALERAAGAV